MTDPLNIDPERCVHQRMACASCAECVTACPTQAWRMNEEGLSFDADACDACGLCVAACPHEALSIAPPTMRHLKPSAQTPALLLACEHAPHGLPNSAINAAATPAPLPVGVTHCLHSLSAVWLVQQIQQIQHAQPAEEAEVQGYLLTGSCATCPRAPKATLDARWHALAQRVQVMGLPFPTVTWCSPSDWAQWAHAVAEDAAARAATTATSSRVQQRWSLFRLARPAPPAPPPSSAPMTSDRTAAVQLLKKARLQTQTQTKAAPLWTVRLDAAACHWCMACVRMCPHAALHLTVAANGTRGLFGIDSDVCTGCGICADLCDTHALSITATHALELELDKAASPQRVFALHQYTCVRCNIHFWSAHVQEGSGLGLGSSKPRSLVCMVCTQGKPQHHQRIIESLASSDVSATSATSATSAIFSKTAPP